MVATAAVLTLVANVTPASAHPRVATDGESLTLDGRRWWPAGLDAYQLATDWSINSGCGAEVDLDAFFASLPPNSLTRFNAFATLATDRVTGARDFRPIDAVFAAAERHGQFVMPVLSSFDGACEDEVFKEYSWYADGWRRPSPPPAGETVVTEMPSYAAWLETALTRWKDSPALAMWDLLGEPEPLVGGLGGTCPRDAATVLRRFADDVGALARGIDPVHPLSLGTIGGGQCGTAGPEFRRLAESPYLDVLQYHDYGADGIPLPGNEFDGLAVRLEQARAVGKPLLVAEIGQYAGGPCGTAEQRAADIAAKIDGQRAAGAAGALLWAFVPDPRPLECTYDIGPDDPVRAVLAERNTVG